MPIYNAPEIKDRIATGDDLYTITDVDGKKKLTPAPTEVTEPGTPINKALMQDIVDALQGATENFVPYENHWWRTRQVSGGYTLKIVPFGQVGESYHYYTSDEFWFIAVTNARSATSTNPEYIGGRTLQYGTKITMDSSGAISIVNPTSIYITSENINSYSSTLNGKYVKGFKENEDMIYKVGTNITITSYYERWGAGGDEVETRTYYGYKFYSTTSTSMEVAVSGYAESGSAFDYVSNSSADFYPHSGTSNGTEYQYLGRISDFAPPVAPCKMKTASITSASWNSKACSIPIPASRYFVTISDDSYGQFIGIIDNLKIYGLRYINKSSWDIRVGVSSLSINSITATPQANALNFTYSGTSSAPVVTVNYLPLT